MAEWKTHRRLRGWQSRLQRLSRSRVHCLSKRRLRWVSLALAAGLFGACACQSTATPRQKLESPYPLDRVTASVTLAERGDVQAVHQLVKLLEDRNSTVRMYAALALKRLTGETYGYEYYAPATERAAAVTRWQEALQRGEVTVQRDHSSHDTSDAPAAHEAIQALAARRGDMTGGGAPAR